ncbi:conjugal transfer protein [Streptomyces sp. BH-SS-21]|uniref:Conjugal transfer protein n=1 Tax=Streptomyces liliiviolaceus TaxID=2823109 RepID=A0A940Y0U0_9ACTN|nr:conjugal transfer protein [Streptomyces liliiviolaceus]MBQ0850245.1 conjugal transfer protein [Streptomyces liliiviolaceus]
MSPGKQAAKNEAEAGVSMAAGVRLEAMQRRVRLSRLALWIAIAAGPVALGVAVTSSPATVEAAATGRPATVRTTAATADPAGYAQLFVGSWLRSSTRDDMSAQARLAQSMAPDIKLPEPVTGGRSAHRSVTAVRSARRAGGVWSVTVAAQSADGAVRYYAVPVAAGRTGNSFTVTGAPAVVAGPARAEVPKTPYGVRVPQGPLSSAVGEFLAAYLTGAGGVDRYLAPGVRLTAVSPAPYTAVTVQQVLAVEKAAAGGRVPADHTKVRVLARVETRDAGGRWPLAYELALTARSGRWDVAALESGTARTGNER